MAEVGDKGYEESDLHYDENSDKNIVKGYISLKNIIIFSKPVSVRENIHELEFIKQRKWGLYFQGGIRQIDEPNFNKILNLSKQ